MSHVAPLLRELNALKNWKPDNGKTSLIEAVYGYKFLQEKRRKHNRVIRVLIYACALLLVTNLVTLYILLCR